MSSERTTTKVKRMEQNIRIIKEREKKTNFYPFVSKHVRKFSETLFSVFFLSCVSCIIHILFILLFRSFFLFFSSLFLVWYFIYFFTFFRKSVDGESLCKNCQIKHQKCNHTRTLQHQWNKLKWVEEKWSEKEEQKKSFYDNSWTMHTHTRARTLKYESLRWWMVI